MFLAGNEGRAEIDKMLQMLAEAGVRSIPTVLIGGRMVGSGAQHADHFRQIFAQVEGEGEDASGTVFAQHLGYEP